MVPKNLLPGPKFVPVILAGGSGTPFWPRSRKSKVKQVPALDGDRTMSQQTLDRLLYVVSERAF
jgi:mannose-1-phosphate guanylyltransferase